MFKNFLIAVVFFCSSIALAIDPIIIGDGPSAANKPQALKCSKVLFVPLSQQEQVITTEIALYNLNGEQKSLAEKGLDAYERFSKSKVVGNLNEAFGSLHALVGGWLSVSRDDFADYEEVLLAHQDKALVYGENGNYKKSKAFKNRYREGLAIAFLIKNLISKGLNSAASNSTEWQSLAYEISQTTELLQYGLRIHRMEAGTHILYGTDGPLMWDIPADSRSETVKPIRLEEPRQKGQQGSIFF